MMKKLSFFLILIISLMLLNSCKSGKKEEIKIGIWKGELTTAGGKLPFYLNIFKDSTGNYSSELLNGDENIKIDDVEIKNDSIKLFLPAFNSTINAVVSDSLLLGALTLVKANAVLQIIPFKAERNINYKFFDKPNSLINLTGRWEAEFTEEDGTVYPSVGEFVQDGSNLKGTFLTTTGDYRYLTGQVKDSSIYLSTFDGGHAFLFKAKLNKYGMLTGGFWSGLTYSEKWKAVKNENAKLPDPDSLTFLKKGIRRFTFTFPDLNGNNVSLTDTKYKNKVVILTLAGSWCPNCHDEAKFLSPLFNKYFKKGLEIISLMYENYLDTARTVEQIKRFQRKFNIKYDLLLAGRNDKDFASKTLPQLNRVLAFPTTIFIDKKGRVRKINTGFSGPGTGEHYIKLTDEITSFVEKLLKE